MHLHPTADLVLLEFAVNDGHGNPGSLASVEGIVRRATTMSSGRAALALVSWWDHWPGRDDNPEHTRAVSDSWRPEWENSAESKYDLVAQYYDVAALSLRNALLYEDLKNVSGFAFDDFADNWNRASLLCRLARTCAVQH